MSDFCSLPFSCLIMSPKCHWDNEHWGNEQLQHADAACKFSRWLDVVIPMVALRGRLQANKLLGKHDQLNIKHNGAKVYIRLTFSSDMSKHFVKVNFKSQR